MATTCECGLGYVKGYPDDEKYHRRLHREYAQGPVIEVLSLTPALETHNNLTIHLVDSSVPIFNRRKIAHIAMVAQRSMPDYKTGYDGTVTEDDQRLYVVREKKRAVGFLLTANCHGFWHLRWANEKVELVSKQPLLETRPTIARVWIAANYRKKGLAKQLICCAALNLGIEENAFCWEMPFTAQGAALARSFYPYLFLGSCDNYTLHQLLR